GASGSRHVRPGSVACQGSGNGRSLLDKFFPPVVSDASSSLPDILTCAMRASPAAMRSRIGLLLCLVHPLMGCQPQPVVQPEKPAVTSPRTTEELIAFVERAAAVVQARGSEAFPELGSRPSIWSHDDTYLFIAEAGTNRIVVHGADR